MAIQIIDIGTAPSAGDGDSLRTSFAKVNANFEELYIGQASLLGNYVKTVSGRTGDVVLTASDLGDVVITTPAPGQVLSFNGTNWVNAAGGSTTLSGLTDVSVDVLAEFDFLMYDGTEWVNYAPQIEDLSNVTITTPTNNQVLTYVDGTWVNSTISSGAPALADLTDVALVTPADGEVLLYDGANWINLSLEVESLANVVVTTPTSGQVLSFNGTNWVNSTPAAGGSSPSLSVTIPDNASVSIDTSLGEYFIFSFDSFSDVTFVSPTPAVANRILAFTLHLNNTGGGNLTWLSNPRWPGGQPPTINTVGTHILEFVSHNDGATWYGFTAGLNMSQPE